MSLVGTVLGNLNLMRGRIIIMVPGASSEFSVYLCTPENPKRTFGCEITNYGNTKVLLTKNRNQPYDSYVCFCHIKCQDHDAAQF